MYITAHVHIQEIHAVTLSNMHRNIHIHHEKNIKSCHAHGETYRAGEGTREEQREKDIDREKWEPKREREREIEIERERER